MHKALITILQRFLGRWGSSFMRQWTVISFGIEPPTKTVEGDSFLVSCVIHYKTSKIYIQMCKEQQHFIFYIYSQLQHNSMKNFICYLAQKGLEAIWPGIHVYVKWMANKFRSTWPKWQKLWYNMK